MARNERSPTDTKAELTIKPWVPSTRAQLQHEFANPSDRRDLLSELTSNRSVFPKNVVVELQEPFHSVAAYLEMHRCDPIRDVPRTFRGVCDTINTYIEEEEARKKRIAAAQNACDS